MSKIISSTYFDPVETWPLWLELSFEGQLTRQPPSRIWRIIFLICHSRESGNPDSLNQEKT